MGGRVGEHIFNFKNQQGINLENTRDSNESTRKKKKVNVIENRQRLWLYNSRKEH